MATTPAKSKKSAKQALPVRTLEKASDKTVATPAFFVETEPAMIARTIHTTHKRMRIRRAHTKERAEVRGGGRKPWKQKGTGRSRHGSSRSPLWVGGGTTFGPRSRKTRIAKTQLKERRRVLAGSFAMHAKNGTLSVLQFSEKMPAKTKDIAKHVQGVTGLLVIVADANRSFARIASNIPNVRVRNATTVMPKDIMEAHTVWIDDAALPVLEVRCSI